MAQTPAAKARSTALTAAKRSLAQILEAAAADDATIKNGGIPDASFTASVRKYEEALAVIRVLDKISAGNGELPGDEARPEDLAALLDLLWDCGVRFSPDQSTTDTPLGRMAFYASWAPTLDGNPA